MGVIAEGPVALLGAQGLAIHVKAGPGAGPLWLCGTGRGVVIVGVGMGVGVAVVVGGGKHVRGDGVGLDGGSEAAVAEVFNDALAALVEVLGGVEVEHVVGGDGDGVIGAEVLKVLVEGDVVCEGAVDADGGLVGPAARDVADGVAAAPEHEQGHAVALDGLDAARMAPVAEVEAAEPVAGQGVCAALQHNRPRPVPLHDVRNDRLEDGVVAGVVDAVAQGHVDRVVLAGAAANVADVPGAGEELAVLVEGDGHDAVGGVEGLLHAVPVVHVNVNVQHAPVVLEQLQDAQHNVVHVAEAGRLPALRVVQPARPVDGNVRLPVVELDGAGNGAPCGDLAELVQPAVHGAVLANVELLRELVVGLAHAVRRHAPQKVHVVVRVEARHVLCAGPWRSLQAQRQLVRVWARRT